MKLNVNKKHSYPQRKCASNMAVLYGADADGISIWNCIGMEHECGRQTAYVRLGYYLSVESIQNAKFDMQQI